MWILTFAESEVVSQIALQDFSLWMFLDHIQNHLVDSGLIGLPLLGGLVSLLLGLEDVALLLGLFLADLGPLEVIVVQLLGDFDRRQVDGGRGLLKEILVDPPHRATVNLERSYKNTK